MGTSRCTSVQVHNPCSAMSSAVHMSSALADWQRLALEFWKRTAQCGLACRGQTFRRRLRFGSFRRSDLEPQRFQPLDEPFGRPFLVQCIQVVGAQLLRALPAGGATIRAASRCPGTGCLAGSQLQRINILGPVALYWSIAPLARPYSIFIFWDAGFARSGGTLDETTKGVKEINFSEYLIPKL